MRNRGFYELFINELRDMYDSEKQFAQSLPKLIKTVLNSDLKEGLRKHSKEIDNHLIRLANVFKKLGINCEGGYSVAMHGLLEEANQLIMGAECSPVTDAAIICALQKVKHYEIASYGTLRSFAINLDLDSEISDLIQDTLDEEAATDKKLTKIADGFIFTCGVNKEAAEYNMETHNR